MSATTIHLVGCLVLGLASTAGAQCVPQTLAANDGESGDNFGASVCVGAANAIAGTPWDDALGAGSGSACVFARRGDGWVQVATLTAPDGAAGDWFGASVSLSGDTAIVGARDDDDRGNQSGSAYIFRRMDGEWAMVAKLVASDGAPGDEFGCSVSICGDFAVVGSWGDDDLGDSSGSAYVFELADGVWTQVAKLTALDGAAFDEFGGAVCLDGQTVLVGAQDANAAYVFDRIGGVWTPGAVLTASHSSGDGCSVSLSGDTAVVGRIGSWYGPCVFERAGGVWTQVAELGAIEPTDETLFGRYVAVDGGTIAVQRTGDREEACVFERVGGVWEQTMTLAVTGGGTSFGDALSVSGDDVLVGSPGVGAGRAYMFDLACLCDPDKLLASDGGRNELFGGAVSGSGGAVLVGATGVSDRGDQAGAAYVFDAVRGVWTEVAKLTASDGAAGDRFGEAVCLDEDTAAVGVRYDDDDGADSGSAYIFERAGEDWTQAAKLTASDGAAGDWFGCSVSVSGGTAVVGALRDERLGWRSGSAYVFDRVDGVWTETAKLIPSDDCLGGSFGSSVSISGDVVVIGAETDGNGSAYVFERAGGVWAQVARLTPEHPASEWFGCSVSVSGGCAFVGAGGNDEFDTGSAFVFEQVGGVWSEVASFRWVENHFGDSVAVYGDRAVVGAQGASPFGEWSGEAYLYERVDGAWTEAATLTAPDAARMDAFGRSVSIGPSYAFAGARWDDDSGPDSGSVYVFNLVCMCPADFNGDGALDIRDMLAFLNAWAAGDERADWDRNGVVNTGDLLAFLNDWATGC